MEIKYEDGVKKEKILLNNKPMRFSLDEKKTIEILQGSNLYRDIFSIFREIIQNSIDATMIRIWESNKNIDFNKLNPVHFKKSSLMDEYKLEITINTVDIEKSIYELIVRDRGTGISVDDLSYMQKIAGSYKNLTKKKIISEMPVWMRPSGEFGIGMHSIFLLSHDLPFEFQKINIKTKSLFSNKCLDLEMYSPLGEKDGYTFISKVDGSDFEVGTEIKVKFLFDDTSNRYIKKAYSLRRNFPLASLSDLDSIVKEFIKREIENKILSRSNLSFSIKVGDNKDVISNHECLIYNGFNEGVVWIKDLNLSLEIYKSLTKSYTNKKCFFFKGQRVESKSFNLFRFFDFNIDFYGFEAKDILLMNREGMNSFFYEKIQKKLIDEIREYLRENISYFSDYFKETSDFYLLKYELGLLDWNDEKDLNGIKGVCLDSSGKFLLSSLDDSDNLIVDDKSSSLALIGSRDFTGISVLVNVSDISFYYRLLILKYAKVFSKKVFEISNSFADSKRIGLFICSENDKLKKIIELIPNNFIFEEVKSEECKEDLKSLIEDFSKFRVFSGQSGVLFLLDLSEELLEFSKLNIEGKIIFPFYRVDEFIYEIELENIVEYFMSNCDSANKITKEECFELYTKFKELIKQKVKDNVKWQNSFREK